MLNLKEKEYCRYDQNLKGSGLRIAVLEFNATPNRQLLNNLNVKVPISMLDTSPMDSDKTDFQHCVLTCGVIRDMLPLAEIYLLPQTDDGVSWIIANNIHIVNASLYTMFADITLQEKMAKSSFCLCASGNTMNSETEGLLAQKKFWTSVTSLHLNEDSISHPNYSSYGLNELDLAGFSNLEILQLADRQIGTSFSSPWVVGLIGQYYERYKLKFGFYPTISETLDFIKDNCRPILNNPTKEGYGLLVLPKDDYSFGTVIKIDSNEINVNGVMKNTINKAITVNGKTMVELTVLRECGKKVYWNDKIKCAIVR